MIFELDTKGGADILQNMCEPLIRRTTEDIANKAKLRASTEAASSDGRVRDLQFETSIEIGAPNKRGGVRVYGRVKPVGDVHDVFEVRKHHILEKAAASANVK